MLENVNRETLEDELWDLESSDQVEGGEESPVAESSMEPEFALDLDSSIPESSDDGQVADHQIETLEMDENQSLVDGEEMVLLDDEPLIPSTPKPLRKASAPHSKAKRSGSGVLPSAPRDEFEDLGEWDELPDSGDLSPEAPSESTKVPENSPLEETPPKHSASEPQTETSESSRSMSAATAPQKSPTASRPSLMSGLSKWERVGLLSLLVVLVVGGLIFLTLSLSKLPKEQPMWVVPDYPVKGKYVTVIDVKTYWREPQAGRDVVRQGTALIPVAEVRSKGSGGALRMFFKDADGKLVGDPVTLTVSDSSKVVVGATAGFEETGMYSAYRADPAMQWKLEVLEGPSANAPADQFKKLFETPIDARRR